MQLFTKWLFIVFFVFTADQLNAQCSSSNASACSCPTVGATDCVLIPDILAGTRSLNSTTGWSEYGQLVNGVDKGLLRIDVSTPNVGWGPLEVISTDDYVCGTDTLRNFFPSTSFLCPDGSFPKRLIKQRLYYKSGNTFQYQMRDAGWMVYHPTHGHIHVEGWGLYTLRLRDVSVADTLQWPIVNSGIKVSFCLIDLTTCSGSSGDCVDANGNMLLDNDFPNFGLGGGYNCGDAMQGISVGMVDIYHRELDESFVKVPYEACNGDYHVVVEIDPDNHFQEMNENNNWLAANVPLIRQRTSNTGAYAYIFSKQGNTSCAGQNLLLEANGASSYLWSTGETTQKINVTQPGRYWVNTTTPCGNATSDTLQVFASGTSSSPSVIITDTICAGNYANLYASGNAHWYDAPVNGNLLHIGNNFQTGSLNNSTPFYVVDQPSLSGGSLGPSDINFSGTVNSTMPKSEYLIFNAFLPFKLKSITVNAITAGTRIIQLRNMYGKKIAERSVTLTAGIQEVPLNIFVPSGMNLQLGLSPLSTVASLGTSTTTSINIGYPFKLSSIANIVGSSSGDKNYPFFYNWKIEGTPQACNNGTRTEVTAIVVPEVQLTISGLEPSYLHTNNPATLTGSPSGGIFSGNGISGNTFDPSIAGTGNHEISYTYTVGNCILSTSAITRVDLDSTNLQNGFSIQIYNNGGQQQNLYVLTNDASQIQLRLFTIAGHLLNRSLLVAARGSNLFPLDLNNVSKGIYILEATHVKSGQKKVFKLLH